ncbi:MAG: hypothetical protein V4443_10485 [Pseudomonadota bacterium]
MKSNKIALLAILLWLLTIAVFAWFFIRGNTMAGTDNRTAVVLKANERDFVLREMRGLLSATQVILHGLNQGNMQQVAQAARAAGMAVAAAGDPILMTKLPMPLKTLGISVHQDMDELARAAESGRPAAELQQMLTATLSKCVACHATWQLQVEK